LEGWGPLAIEIKGDKEKMKEMLSGLPRREFPSRHFGGGFWGSMDPWCCSWEEEGAE